MYKYKKKQNKKLIKEIKEETGNTKQNIQSEKKL